MATQLTIRTGSSVIVDRCQICDYPELKPVLFLGYMPPVNLMPKIGQPPRERAGYPAQLLHCPKCQLVQLGLIVDPEILFPPEYPYTSGTTKILRDNFAEFSNECRDFIEFKKDDLVIDIGSNDGTLLSNFTNSSRVLGVEPTQAGDLALKRNIPTLRAFFNRETAQDVRREHGAARLVTAANVFAHMEQIHDVVDGIVDLMDDKALFVSESHYLVPLIESLQYDTIYHEHLRYYSLHSLQHLLQMHGLEVIHAKRIPTHGGSIRVYSARRGDYPIVESVARLLQEEDRMKLSSDALDEFRKRVVLSKLELQALLKNIKQRNQRIFGIGAPSRASTLINYVGLDEAVLDCVLEVSTSSKLDKYIPGTLIPVEEEGRLFREQPEYALLLSWHIADELMPKLVAKGFKGDFVIPLPTPRIVRGGDVG